MRPVGKMRSASSRSEAAALVESALRRSGFDRSSKETKRASIRNRVHRRVEERNGRSVWVEVNAVEALILSAMLVHEDAAIPISSSPTTRVSRTGRCKNKRKQNAITHQASPSFALTLPSLFSSIKALLHLFVGFTSSSSLIPSAPGSVETPSGARPLKAMLRLMSRTAEAERSFATTYLRGERPIRDG
jgi:hypothetical protein